MFSAVGAPKCLLLFYCCFADGFSTRKSANSLFYASGIGILPSWCQKRLCPACFNGKGDLFTRDPPLIKHRDTGILRV